MRKLEAIALSVALLGSFAVGCGGKPTQEQCQEFADKFVALMLAGDAGGAGQADEAAQAVADELKAELVDDCVKEGTKKEVDCVLAASSMEDVEKNCQ